MMSLIASGGMSLYKRSSEEGNMQISGWGVLLILLDWAIFAPIILMITYTLGAIFPTLAIVENPNPPIYERVSLNADDESIAEDNAGAPAGIAGIASSDPGVPPKPITASLRATSRLLRSVGGWRSNFRGLACALVQGVAALFAAGIFSSLPFVPSFAGTLLVYLVMSPLSTAWVHVVISRPSPDPFWRRLLPIGRVFRATYLPILAYWLASTLSSYVPFLLARATSFPVWDPSAPAVVPVYSASDSWKGFLVVFSSLAIWALAVVPASVVLVRVQASMLPPEEDTIIPVDRSFGSTVEPALIGGRGYVSPADAFRTVSRASWLRIYLLHVKIWGASVLVYLLMFAIIIPQIMFLTTQSSGRD